MHIVILCIAILLLGTIAGIVLVLFGETQRHRRIGVMLLVVDVTIIGSAWLWRWF